MLLGGSVAHYSLKMDKRRERDSNPRRLAPQRFSRPPHSTALPSLPITTKKWPEKRFVLPSPWQEGTFQTASKLKDEEDRSTRYFSSIILSHHLPVCPKPPEPRSVSSSSATTSMAAR